MHKTQSLAVFLIAVIFLAVSLSGCVYSSSNLLRAQGKEVNVLGAWGWVNCKDSSITMYRSTDAVAYPKDPNTKYPKVPPRPNIQEEAESTSFNVGKPTLLAPKADTGDDGTTSAVAGVAGNIINN